MEGVLIWLILLVMGLVVNLKKNQVNLEKKNRTQPQQRPTPPRQMQQRAVPPRQTQTQQRVVPPKQTQTQQRVAPPERQTASQKQQIKQAQTDIFEKAQENVKENDVDLLKYEESDFVREINDLILMGYQVDESTQRDFVSEGVEMLIRIEQTDGRMRDDEKKTA